MTSEHNSRIDSFTEAIVTAAKESIFKWTDKCWKTNDYERIQDYNTYNSYVSLTSIYNSTIDVFIKPLLPKKQYLNNLELK